MTKLRIEEALSIRNKDSKDHMNKKQLAERIKYKNFKTETKQQLISGLISGSDKPVDRDIVRQISVILEVPTDYLYNLSDIEKTPEQICKKLSELIDKTKEEKDEILG